MAFVQDYADGVDKHINQLHPEDYRGVQAFERARGMDHEENSFTLDVYDEDVSRRDDASVHQCASPCWEKISNYFSLIF